MISNERRWPFQQQAQRLAQPYFERPAPAFKPTLREDTLETRRLQIERKQFLLMLKENPRGRFMRIAEESNGRANSIIIPAAGLKDFQKMLDAIVSAASELAPSPSPETESAKVVENGVASL